MSSNEEPLPTEFATLNEARDNLAWVEARLKEPDTNWADYGDIFREYIDALAKSFSQSALAADDCEECYESLPTKNYPFNKSHYEGWFEDAVQRHGHPQAGSCSLVWQDGMPLDFWIDEHLVELTIVEYSDSNMKAKHEWLFEYGDKRQLVETDKHHNSASEFENAIEDNFPFVEVDDPAEEYREGSAWKRQFIRPLKNKDDRIKRVVRPGPRSKCIESLTDMLEVRTAYHDINRADDADGVYIDPAEPDWMYVRSSLIAHEATEHGFNNTEPIRRELEFRHVVNGKVSEQKALSDGRRPRWWKLPRDFADVNVEDKDETPAGSERFVVNGVSGGENE